MTLLERVQVVLAGRDEAYEAAKARVVELEEQVATLRKANRNLGDRARTAETTGKQDAKRAEVATARAEEMEVRVAELAREVGDWQAFAQRIVDVTAEAVKGAAE